MSYNNIKDLKQAYEEGTVTLQAYNDAAMALDAVSDLEGLDADELEDYSEYLQDACKNSDLLSDELADNADSAADLAVEITRMNKGIDTLADGFKEWKDILKNSSKESAEYAKAMK